MRDLAKSSEARESGAVPVQLDVTDQASVEKALAALPELDVLINNAGVLGTSFGVDDLDAEAMQQSSTPTSTASSASPRQPYLAAALVRPVIVNVTSGVGWPRNLLDRSRRVPRQRRALRRLQGRGDRADRAVRQEPAVDADQHL